MDIKLYCKYAFNLAPCETVEVYIDSMDVNFYECCRKAVKGKYPITFNRYYGKSPVMDMTRSFPYILRNDVYIWNVPYSDVSVAEFLATHALSPDEIIEIDAGNVGSAGELFDWAYQAWVSLKPVFDVVGDVLTAYEIVKIIKKAYGTVKNHVPRVGDFYQLLRSRDVWNMDELVKHTGLEEHFLKMLLRINGYLEAGDRKYKYNDNKAANISEIRYKKYGHADEWYYLNEMVYEFNTEMIYLQALSVELEDESVLDEAVGIMKKLPLEIPELFRLDHAESSLMLCEGICRDDYTMETANKVENAVMQRLEEVRGIVKRCERIEGIRNEFEELEGGDNKAGA